MHESDIRHTNASLQQKLAYLYGLRTGSKVNWDQEEYRKLLAAFGNPHLNLPPVIHVAGTNGKGSIVATLKSILEAQGYKVHSYTSPHLIHVNERIYLAGKEISDDALESLIDKALGYIGTKPLSFFEIMTAIAFKAFAQTPADVLLLEVGCGGRLDCTNVIENPLCTIISRISMDHMEFLGNTLSEIAAEKAGIMKVGIPCISSYQGEGKAKAQIEKTLIKTAQKTPCKLIQYDQDWQMQNQDNKIVLTFKNTKIVYPVPNLPGQHQMWNAGAALMALKSISAHLPVSEEAIMKGLQQIAWPGRLQKLSVQKWHLTIGWELWLDSGHNDSAGEVLATQIKEWAIQDQKPLHLIVGMLGTKDIGAFLRPLMPHVQSLSIIPIPGEKGSKTARGIPQAKAYPDYQTALKAIFAQGGEGRILIAGSVYLAGDVLKFLR